MNDLASYLNGWELQSSLSPDESRSLAADVGQLSGMEVYPRSLTAARRTLFFLGRREGKKLVGALSEAPQDHLAGQRTKAHLDGQTLTLTISDASPVAAAAIRTALPFLTPRPLGLRKSAGFGDRIGLATPGHVRAARGTGIAPIFAQQSMRENARTGRTPQDVMDDALWGAFQEGWREGFGADADHLKSAADIDVCAAAGYSFFTIDPGEFVDNAASSDAQAVIERKVADLPWDRLESAPRDLESTMLSRPIDLGSFSLPITREDLLRAAAKYGRAVAHTAAMHRHLSSAMGARPFELEMSVDETETVSTLAEHVYIAAELKRLRVRCVSLAPRYVGSFEKGVDYIGDLSAFEKSFAGHLAVAKAFGPYKLSLHSGSDKFSIYPIAARLAGDLVHLKTAGTSYLEALRAIARLHPSLFRDIAAFAVERYPSDRASYHVSADASKMPSASSLGDAALPTLLEDFHAREILHVTFGSVINDPRFREPFFATLKNNEDIYSEIIKRHFAKHLAPFRAV